MAAMDRLFDVFRGVNPLRRRGAPATEADRRYLENQARDRVNPTAGERPEAPQPVVLESDVRPIEPGVAGGRSR